MERYWQAGFGLIEIICGPMFSGKTEELIRRLRRVQIAQLPAVVFKPKIDIRYQKEQIVSHSAQVLASAPVDDVAAMKTHLAALPFKPTVIGIDEAQFFGMPLVELVQTLADDGLRVVVAGLDQDYLGKPFGPMPELLAIADLVTKQHAVCISCGAAATKTQRVKAAGNGHEPLVAVGAADSYEARCRRCFVPRVDLPTGLKNRKNNDVEARTMG